MGLFTQKKVWHSYLRAKSPVVLRFKGPVVQSKFLDNTGEYPNIIYFEVKGDPTDGYYYFIENDDVLEYLRSNAQPGEWVKLTATGGSTDEHQIDLQPAGGDDENTGQYLSKGLPAKSVSVDARPMYGSGVVAEDYEACLVEAVRMVNEHLIGTNKEAISKSPEAFATLASVTKEIATTMFINWSNNRYETPLSSADVEVEYVEDAKMDMGENVLEALDKLPKRSGKSHDGRNLKSTINKIEDSIDTLDDESYHQIMDWIDKEVGFQSTTEEEIEDDLPF